MSVIGRPEEAAPVDAPREPAMALPMIASLSRAEANAPALCAIDLSKRYGGLRAVDHVSFAVREGSIHGVIGRTAPANPRCSSC